MKEVSMHKEAGFTLIEIIVTIIIAAILASIAGLGIVQGVKGYVFAWENSAMTQKAELAMARMSLELRDISNVTNAESETITYTRDSSNHTIAFDSGNGQVTIDSKKLVEGVSSLTLSYKKRKIDGNEENWDIDNDPIGQLVIHIDLKMKHTETEDEDINDITFTTTINPRNVF